MWFTITSGPTGITWGPMHHSISAGAITRRGEMEFNFDDADHEAVREFFLGNPMYWMEKFHIDGFRFDATH